MAKGKFKKTYRGIAYMLAGFALIYVLLSSTMTILSRQDDIAKLKEQVNQIQREKKELENEVNLLNDEDYVTRYARENYIFTRDGEEVAILPENAQE